MRLLSAVVLAAASLAGACVTSTPRAFVADIQPLPADRIAFDALFLRCADQVAAGRRENFETGQIEAGPATGAATATAGAALVYAGASAGWSGLTTIGAGSGLVILAPVAAAGVSAAQRSGREQAIQEAMGACLRQSGYTVVGWRTPTPAEIEAGALTTPTAPHIAQPAAAR